MVAKNKAEMIRELINKIYNEPELSDEILNDIDKDLSRIEKDVDENKAYRELCVLLEAAKKQKNVIARANFKYAILSGLEREYRSIVTQNAK